MEWHAFRHILHASNGEAKHFIQTLKYSLKAGNNDSGTLHQNLTRFLLISSTPHSTTGVSPAELFLKCRLRTRLDLLRPSSERKLAAKQTEQNNYHDEHRTRESTVGQMIIAQNLQGELNWLKGTVITKTGPVSYKVQVEDRTWRHHVNHWLLNTESDTKEQTSLDDYVHIWVRTEQPTQNEEPTYILPKKTLILVLHRITQMSLLDLMIPSIFLSLTIVSRSYIYIMIIHQCYSY